MPAGNYIRIHVYLSICRDIRATIVKELLMTCKAEMDVEDIGMVRGRATHSPHAHPTKTRNRKSSRFITRHSLPTHTHVSVFSKSDSDPSCVLDHDHHVHTDAAVGNNSHAAAI